MTTQAVDPDCELCQAARFTEWFHEDDDCWIAECESCSVPMVVWKTHDPDPPADVKTLLHARLATVMAREFEDEHVVDDNLRTIPTHYHAHARRRAWGRGFRRRNAAS